MQTVNSDEIAIFFHEHVSDNNFETNDYTLLVDTYSPSTKISKNRLSLDVCNYRKKMHETKYKSNYCLKHNTEIVFLDADKLGNLYMLSVNLTANPFVKVLESFGDSKMKTTLEK